MTVSYTAEVATSGRFGFLKLLFKWRGSVYKLVWMDLIAFLTLYYSINFIYRLWLNDSQKRSFESFVVYCKNYGTLIPLSFVLGFYVSIVMTRWWDQYIAIPWPDTVAVFVSVHVHGQDERGRVMRRTVMRYVCLCLTMVLGMISPRVKRRFPTLDHLVEAGLLLDNEKTVIQAMDAAFPKHPKHWMPIVWAASIITRARKEGRIRDDFAVKTIIDELNRFRGSCGVLMFYDTISVPLVYTQVVTLAVYTYFLCSVLSYQWTEQTEDGYINYVDCYFPIFSTLQFFFYMGWLKVAESLINPFGEDDDDFEVNWIIDRNLQMSYLIVDEMHHEHPELVRDQYWDDIFPNELPYANEADAKREDPPEPSTARINVNPPSVPRSQLHLTNGSIISPSQASKDVIINKLSRMFTPDRKLSPANVTKQASPGPSAARDPVVKISGNVRIHEAENIKYSDTPQTPPSRRVGDVSEDDERTTPSSSLRKTEGDSEDEFEQLRLQREKERQRRQTKRLRPTVFNIGSQPQTESDVSQILTNISTPVPTPSAGSLGDEQEKENQKPEENNDDKKDKTAE